MKRFLFFFAAATLTALLGPDVSFAQTTAPELFITWRAYTSAPAGFRGKVLPSPGATIAASFEIVERGGFVDLSEQEIYWYVNDELVSNRPGVQRIAFRAPAVTGPMDLRVQLPDYKGAALLKTIEVPVVPPEAVIEVPFPGGRFYAQSIRLWGRPYFFDARGAGLGFSWAVNGGPAREGTGSPEPLEMSFSPTITNGARFSVELSIRNLLNPLQGARTTKTLTFRR